MTLISGTFLFFTFFFSSLMRNLIGQLEDWHFRRSSFNTHVCLVDISSVWIVSSLSLFQGVASFLKPASFGAKWLIILIQSVVDLQITSSCSPKLLTDFINWFTKFKNKFVCIFLLKKKLYSYVFERHCCSCWMIKSICCILRRKWQKHSVTSPCYPGAVVKDRFSFSFVSSSSAFSLLFFVSILAKLCQEDAQQVGTWWRYMFFFFTL